jgi:hypothetical protein
MRVRTAVPRDISRDEKKSVLDAMLESVTRANQALIARGLPLFREALAGGIRWRPEPPGDEHFDLGSTVLKRGWGDCDDLAPWEAASLRAHGQDARAIVRPSGPNRWHAVVELPGGQILDPSKAAGMGSGVSGSDIYSEYRGPFWPAMFGRRLGIASRPLGRRRYAARIDVPSLSEPAAYSLVSTAPNRADAIVGACLGALGVCGEDADELHLTRLGAMHDLLCGADPDELEHALAERGVVGFLPALTAALPIAKGAFGGALSALMPGQKGGGGGPAVAPGGAAAAAPGGGGMSIPSPAGPIIITRF